MQSSDTKGIRQAVEQRQQQLLDMCRLLIAVPSTAPDGDTREMARTVCRLLKDVQGATVQTLTQLSPAANVLAVLDGNGPGRRLVINGHMDTYPVTDEHRWRHPPFSGAVEDGKIYGRGAGDMKCGIGCALLVFLLMAQWRQHWCGQLVLTLVGDEQAMGPHGTQFLLDTQPQATGDAMISADAGSPRQLCFGEKGYLWVEFEATGKMVHGAQVTKGINAINWLMEVADRVNREVPDLPFRLPEPVAAALAEAEACQPSGDLWLLRHITVNLGLFEGGVSANLVPDKARAKMDIRLPAGATCRQVLDKLNDIVARAPGVSYRVMSSFDPNWSSPRGEIFTLIGQAADVVLPRPACLTYRIGASDAKFYRRLKQVPTVTCGLTAHNHGGIDEYVCIDEMIQLCRIYLHTALAYLGG